MHKNICPGGGQTCYEIEIIHGGNLRSSDKISKSIMVGLFGSWLIGLGLFQYLQIGDLDRDAPLISDEVNRYFTMDFVPKYRVEECVVRFNLHLKDSKHAYLEEINLAFWQYLNENESQIGTMIYQNYVWPDHYVYFADQCDRRDAIFSGMVENVDRHFGDRMKIERLPIKGPVQGFMGLWLDSPDYNPSYWPTLHRAVRGDGRALMEMADFSKSNNHDTRHLFNSLAVHYLPDGPLKKEARQLAEIAFQKMLPVQQERSGRAINYWIENIQKYKSP